MYYRNIFWIVMLFFALTGFKIGPPGEAKKWVISENSNLHVNGSTNINKFSCEIPSYDQTDTLTITKAKSNKEVLLSGCIRLKVQAFDCHNVIMTHDLRKTLKESQYPVLHIYFLSLNRIPVLSSQPETVTGLVDIEIAGVRKRFEVNYQISVDPQNVIHLIGTRQVNFTDFKLVPPRKLGGMIRTNDQLGVDFHLRMSVVNG
jgi:hypothetical protein